MLVLARDLVAVGLTGSEPGWQVVRGSVEAQASLHVNGSPSPLAFQAEVLESSDKRGEEAPAATEVHVCFALLLITVEQAAKPLCLQPLHQSEACVLQ